MSNALDAMQAVVARLRRDVEESKVGLRLGTLAAGGVVLDGETAVTPAVGATGQPGARVVTAHQGRRTYVLEQINTGSFDPSRSLYAPAGSLARWRNRVQAAKYGRSTTVAVVGSSSVAGIGATTIPQGWAHLLRGRFEAAGYPIQGTGLMLAGCAYLAADPRWTFSTSGVSSPARVDATLDDGAWVEVDTDVDGAYVKVYYYNDYGPFSVTIDGGTPQTVTPTGSAEVSSWTSSLLSTGLHTVRVTATSSSPARIVGVDSYRTAINGLSVTVAGIGATTSATWSTSFYTSALPNAIRRPAALTVIAVNGNDFTLDVARETTRSRFTSMANILRMLASEPLFVLMPHVDGSDVAAYRAHASVLYEVADSKGVAVVDMADRWGSYSLANAAGLFADGVHPSQRGHELYADAIFNVLTS